MPKVKKNPRSKKTRERSEAVKPQSNKRAVSPKVKHVVEKAIKELSGLPVTRKGRRTFFDKSKVILNTVFDIIAKFDIKHNYPYKATFIQRLMVNPDLCRTYLNSLEEDKFKWLVAELMLMKDASVTWVFKPNNSAAEEIRLHPSFLIFRDCAGIRSRDCWRELLGDFDIASMMMLALNEEEKRFIISEFRPDFIADYTAFSLKYYLQETRFFIPDINWMSALFFSRDLAPEYRKILLSDEMFLRMLSSPRLDRFFGKIANQMKAKPDLISFLLFNLCVLFGVVERDNDAVIAADFKADWLHRIEMCLKVFPKKMWLADFNTKHGDLSPLGALIQYQDPQLTQWVTGFVEEKELLGNMRSELKVTEYVKLFRILLALPLVRESALSKLPSLKVKVEYGEDKSTLMPLLIALTGILHGLEMLLDNKAYLHQIPVASWCQIEDKTGLSALWYLCLSDYNVSPDKRSYASLERPVGQDDGAGILATPCMPLGLAILRYWLDGEEAVMKAPVGQVDSESGPSHNSKGPFLLGIFSHDAWRKKCNKYTPSFGFQVTSPTENLTSTVDGLRVMKKIKELFPYVRKNSTTAHSPGASRSLTH